MKNPKPDTILRLTFDEGKGAKARDAAGNLPDGDIEYRFLNAAYAPNRDPQWRKCGVKDGCLLFDGSSTAIGYPKGAVALGGGALTISAWVAPRAFEWEEPGAEGRDDAPLTTLVSQLDRQRRQGLLFGYHRFGRLCFQFGTGGGWRSVWSDGPRLRRLAWNHVAAVFDGEAGEARLYQDGKRVGVLSFPAGTGIVPADGERLMIGKNPHAEAISQGFFNMFAGLMDELCIENRALSDQEILEMASLDVPEIAYSDIGLENLLTGDVFKTQYHGGPYQHWMNEPHAPVYYNGIYHLFFQGNSMGPYWRGISWGHLVSGDTVRWRPIRDAIVPEEGGVCPDGVWSGGSTLDANGVPVLFFAAADYGFAEKDMISNQNIGVAWPADLADPELAEWVVTDELAIVQQPGEGRPGEFRDAHVWREDGTWYMVVCSGSAQTSSGTALLYETDVLEVRGGGIDMNWRYRGPVYEMPDPKPIYGTSWELPILLPLKDKSGTHSRHAFFFMPAPADTADNKVYYFVGDFDRQAGRFIPDPVYSGVPRLMDYGANVFTGPSVLVDPVTGRVCMFSIMQGQRSGREEGLAGWARCAGLTRNIWLSEDGTDVRVGPDPRLYSLLGEKLLSLENAEIKAVNRALEGVRGDMLYIRAKVTPKRCETFGFTFKADGQGKGPAFVYDCRDDSLTCLNGTNLPRLRPARGPVPLRDGALAMEVFIDRSLVEGFFNDDKALSIRSYGDPGAQRMAFFADGELLVDCIQVVRMDSIY